MIRYDPTLVDLTSIFFFLCPKVIVYLYIFHGGWSLIALIFMMERGNQIALRMTKTWETEDNRINHNLCREMYE